MKEEGFDDALNVRLSRSLRCFFIFEECGWKENISEKELTRWFPKLNFLSKKEKEGKSSLHLLFMSIRGDFMCNLYLRVRLSMEILWGLCSYNSLEIRMLLMMWLGGSDEPLRRNLPYNFIRWKYIGMRPKMALISAVGVVWKALDIQRAALYCIFHSTLRGQFSQSLKPPL